ncbi:MAG: hypothetical protein JWN07_3627 [Hyphomicrobiales bacterium]|nr:hypothetical protein [Hyphomicrobiales bacterium]
MSKAPNNPQAPAKSKAEEQADLTEQLEDTFPASDPPSMTQPNSTSGAPHGKKSSDTGVEAELARQQAAKNK